MDSSRLVFISTVDWFSTYQFFVPLPHDETLVVTWPTPNRTLLDFPEKFFAKTRVNPDYGKPGFTRDCGERFHRGCDIAPCYASQVETRTRVMFTDCVSGKEFESDESSYVPHDSIFSVVAGTPVEIVVDTKKSDFGKYIVLKHVWPISGKNFYTLYAHLADITCNQDMPVLTGKRIGLMGQTSRSVDARAWMSIAPHLHFEVRNEEGKPYNPADFLRTYLCRELSRADQCFQAANHSSLTDTDVVSGSQVPKGCS